MKRGEKFLSQYDQIVLYRHVNPDLDAFGSQMGLYWTLKSLYPKKNIVMQGEMTSDLLKFYPSQDNEELKEGSTVGLVLDTANHERIDGDLSVCDFIVKIDHHLVCDSYGDINIEVESASSCCEIVSLLLQEEGIVIPKVAAEALYLGIIGDSNRFLYSSTTQKTFQAASYLLDMGIHIDALYQQLYLKRKADLEITKYIYNHYEEDGPIAWYYLSQETLDGLNMTREQGSQYVNTLANIEEFKIWMALTENVADHNYRVSIRSRQTDIHEVAQAFGGGGHAFASGATLQSLDQLPQLIEKLKEKYYE